MDLPSDIETLKAELAAALLARAAQSEHAARVEAELASPAPSSLMTRPRSQPRSGRSPNSSAGVYGPRSERTQRLLDQMELELEELETAATEDEIAGERAAAKTTNVAPFTRKRRPAAVP